MQMTIDYLESYLKLKREADDLAARIDAMTGVSGVHYSPLPKSETMPEGLDVIVIERDRLKRRWENKYAEAVEVLLAIESYVDEVKDPLIRTAIRLKYIDGASWEETGKALRYDPSWVRKKVMSYVEE